MDVGCDGSALTTLVPQSDPKVVCGTIKLCQPRGSPEGALKFQEPPPAPAQDFAQLSIPLISGVPLLLQPQDAPRAQVPAQPHQHPAVSAPSLLITPLTFWGAAVIPQEPGDLCGDCARLVAAVQVELGAFARSLASRAEKECEGLAPVLAQRVRSQSHLAWGGEIEHGVKPLGAHHAPFSPHSASATWPSTRTQLPGCSGTW